MGKKKNQTNYRAIHGREPFVYTVGQERIYLLTENMKRTIFKLKK
jgi:hypothetical protein